MIELEDLVAPMKKQRTDLSWRSCVVAYTNAIDLKLINNTHGFQTLWELEFKTEEEATEFRLKYL